MSRRLYLWQFLLVVIFTKQIFSSPTYGDKTIQQGGSLDANSDAPTAVLVNRNKASLNLTAGVSDFVSNSKADGSYPDTSVNSVGGSIQDISPQMLPQIEDVVATHDIPKTLEVLPKLKNSDTKHIDVGTANLSVLNTGTIYRGDVGDPIEINTDNLTESELRKRDTWGISIPVFSYDDDDDADTNIVIPAAYVDEFLDALVLASGRSANSAISSPVQV